MGKTMNQDLEKIRHYQGTVGDFKNFFDQKAAETAKDTDENNTNAFGTPEYQGFNDVHPTRGANASPHWDESNSTSTKADRLPLFEDFQG